MKRREFVNKLPDYEGGTVLKENGEVESQLNAKLVAEVSRHFTTVCSAVERKLVSSNDFTVYTGMAGQALLCLLLHERTGSSEYLKRALSLVEPCLGSLRCRTRDCTFLCGDAGPLSVAAVACHRLGRDYYAMRDQCVARVVSMHASVASDKSLPDEMLYGRGGYLYALLFLERHIGAGTVDSRAMETVSSAMVASGERLQAKMGKPCLMYSWCDELYAGAAHGHAGILYILLKLRSRFPALDAQGQLRRTVDYLMSVRFPSGNCPCTLGDTTDELVHFCHGAPGWIYMFGAAYEAYGDKRYLDAAADCADVVWSRGLLRKGYGLCHGVAGNAYAFLFMFRLTGEPKHLHRACQFAGWCFTYGTHGCRTPDTPYSLFEGLAGTVYFLLDLQVPGKSRFPAFEL